MDKRFQVGEWTIDPESGSAQGPQGGVRLEPRALSILTELASFSGELRSRQQLLESAWGGQAATSTDLEHTLDEVRQALGDDEAEPTYIESDGDGGYRLIAAVHWLGSSPDAERFDVREQIGSGGMGVVYRAIDNRLGRTVALKFLPQQWSHNQRAKERFLVEARAAAALDHPHICPIHEIAETEEGRLFIVMPFYDGKGLDDRLRRGPLPVEEAIGLACQAARGLEHAHAAGIVHRDIKPANLMLTADGTIKVLDFGLAKFAGTEGLTATGALLGTPSFMSPEQACGKPVDQRTDIWSLGAVLFEMVSGRRLFGGESDHAILRAVIDEPVKIELGPSVPDDLPRVLGKMLEREPERRYASCSQLLADLGPSAPPSTQTPASEARTRVLPPGAASKPASRSRLRLAIAGLILASLTTGWWVWRGQTATESPALEEIEGSPSELTREGRQRLVHHYDEAELDSAIGYFEQALLKDPEHAPAYAALAEAYRRKHDINNDEVQLSRARASAERAVELNEHLASARTALGLTLVATGEPGRGERELRKALELDPNSPSAHRELALALRQLNEGDAARAALERALELDGEDWWSWTQLGSLHFSQGRYAEAEQAFVRSTELTPENPWAFRNLAAAMQLQERYAEAATALQRSLEIRPSDSTYSNLGTLLFVQGKYGDAVAAFERAVDLNPNTPHYWGNLGDAYRWAPGRAGDAPQAFERAAELASDFLASNPTNTTVRGRLALFLAKAGRPREASAQLEQVLAAGEPDANGWYRVLLTYELTGQRSEALDALGSTLAAGYPVSEIEREPELIDLRRDRRYHDVVSTGR